MFLKIFLTEKYCLVGNVMTFNLSCLVLVISFSRPGKQDSRSICSWNSGTELRGEWKALLP